MKNTKFDLVLITPFINDKNINNLLQSIDSNNIYKILIVIIDMSNLELNFNELNFINNFQLVHIKKNSILSSSASRNVGLNYLFSNKIDFNYLMFPDDDSTFDNSFWNEFLNINGENIVLNLLSTGTNEKYARYNKNNDELITKYDVDFIGCVRFLFTKKLIIKLGYFDERMGIGAKYGAGEDGDYLLRALNFSRLVYKEKLFTFHPSASDKHDNLTLKQLIVRYTNYGKGVMFLLCKHKLYYSALKIIFKGVVAFLFYLITFKFKLAISYFITIQVRILYFIVFYLKFKNK